MKSPGEILTESVGADFDEFTQGLILKTCQGGFGATNLEGGRPEAFFLMFVRNITGTLLYSSQWDVKERIYDQNVSRVSQC